MMQYNIFMLTNNAAKRVQVKPKAFWAGLAIIYRFTTAFMLPFMVLSKLVEKSLSQISIINSLLKI